MISKPSLWRTLVLSHFDFTVIDSWTLNNEIYDGPGEGLYYLEEGLKLWSNVNIAFRPSQFEFLSLIQQGHMNIDEWPHAIDPIQLYLVHFIHDQD